MTTGKTIALTRQAFVDKVMSLLFNMLSRLVITFLPRNKSLFISWLQLPSVVILVTKVTQSCPTLCDPMDCRSPGFPVLHYFLKFAQTHVHWVGDAIQPSHALLPPSRVFNLSQHQGLFQLVSSSQWVAKVLELQPACPSNEYSGLISDLILRIDWLDLLAVQGPLKSLLQQHGLKASILWHSAFFMAQLSHPYITIGKTIALTRQTFVVLFNMQPMLVIAFLPRSKYLLISWMQSTSAVILEARK